MSRNDVYGKGLLDYYEGKKDAEFIVESDIAETEIWPIKLFFRDYSNMPKIEKIALKEAKGKIIDVGAGAGSHSLILQEKGFDVTAIDISPRAIQVMQKRGLKKVLQEDFFALNEDEKYDTILMLMNGIGITGNINNLNTFFIKARNLLSKNGRIVLDSSDLIYLYDDIESFSEKYYGEINYKFIYNNEQGNEFSWIFVDFETLLKYAELNGFTCEKIYEDDHFTYLAKLSINY